MKFKGSSNSDTDYVMVMVLSKRSRDPLEGPAAWEIYIVEEMLLDSNY
jgi:hypothetical protein